MAHVLNRLLPLVVALCFLGCKSSDGPPPNILLIMADDLGYEALGVNGSLEYETPRLDALAESGVRFTNAHSTPLCTPTRVQIMTGKYGFRNYVEFGYLDTTQTTFAHLLRDAGYRTAVAGKWQLQLDDDPQTPHHFGFDEYLLWQLAPGDYWHRYKHPIVQGSETERDTLFGSYGPDVFTEFIGDFIERHERDHADRPFFVYYPMVIPHEPFQPPPGIAGFEQHEVVGLNDTTYFGEVIQHMDQAVGRLVDRLDRLGLREETLVIFTGDNGTDVDVQTTTRDGVVRGGKGLPIVTGTHVPLIASLPGQVRSGVSEALVDFTDIVPTLMDAATAPLPDDFLTDGLSFYPQLIDGDGPTREWVFCDYDGKDGVFPAGRWAHDARYKLYADGRMFDYLLDPLEERPLDRDALDSSARASVDLLQAVLDRVDRAKATATPMF